MIIWLGLSIMLIASGLLLIIRRYIPRVFNTWGLFIAITLINLVCFDFLYPNATALNNVQFWIDLVFIASILQQIWFGSFTWTFTAAAIIWEYIAYHICHALLSLYYIKLTPEIPFALENMIFSFALIIQIVRRCERFHRNYRFWMILNIAAYYSIGFWVFVLEFTATGISTEHIQMSEAMSLHEFGFCLAVLFVLISMALWFFNIKSDQTTKEKYLLPHWLDSEIMFWEVPRILGYRKAILRALKETLPLPGSRQSRTS